MLNFEDVYVDPEAPNDEPLTDKKPEDGAAEGEGTTAVVEDKKPEGEGEGVNTPAPAPEAAAPEGTNTSDDAANNANEVPAPAPAPEEEPKPEPTTTSDAEGNKPALNFDTLYKSDDTPAPKTEDEGDAGTGEGVKEGEDTSVAAPATPEGDKGSEEGQSTSSDDKGAAEEGKKDKYSEADYEAAASAIANLESMKMNVSAIVATSKSVPGSVETMVQSTCNNLLRRFKIDYDHVNFESGVAEHTGPGEAAIARLEMTCSAISIQKNIPRTGNA